jgi:ribonuclease HI
MSADGGVWDILVDGASRGNPGRAAAGVRITDPEGTVLFEEGRPLGTTTNNQAEYQALLIGLREAALLEARRIRVRTDSQLLVRQLLGEYRVRNPALRDLHAEAMRLAGGFASFEIAWVGREEVRPVDALARAVLRRTAPRPGTTGRVQPPSDTGG